jgi:hypothetical protein
MTYTPGLCIDDEPAQPNDFLAHLAEVHEWRVKRYERQARLMAEHQRVVEPVETEFDWEVSE